jgi:outer membrane protein assembly factor BamA
MAKLKLGLSLLLVLTQFLVSAQGYPLRYQVVAGDSLQRGLLQDSFPSRLEASLYLARLPSLLQTRGYLTASLDSLLLDSTEGRVQLYLGDQYRWARLEPSSSAAALLESLRWNERTIRGAVDFALLSGWQQKVLDRLEEEGHPFGRVYLDSIAIERGEVSALLQIDRGPRYKIDSIRVYGEARVNNGFLQRYLDLPNGSYYNRKKLGAVSKKLLELPYLEEEQPSSLSLLGTGSVLNLYLRPKRSSQINALIGFLPNNETSGERKLLLTVDANLLLRNAFGGGETIGLVWQQLQQRSPRLNLLFEQPYLFRSPFGLNFSLDLYRRDSVFLNLNINLGTTYRISERQTGGLFIQRRQSIVSGLNLQQIIQTRRLPQEVDVASWNLGVSYAFNSTDYRFNPRKGNELTLTATAGTKQIKKNPQVLQLKDPGDPSFQFERLYDTVKLSAYQLRLLASAAHYIRLGGQSVLKTALNAGIFASPSYFRNELFQIGGYRLLRGFDEESQFVSQYAIGTVEYRYLIGQNSAFFAFLDGGYGRHQLEANPQHTYFSTGLGLSYEARAGIFNIAWAVGKRDDVAFNLRNSKIHLGFVSYF